MEFRTLSEKMVQFLKQRPALLDFLLWIRRTFFRIVYCFSYRQTIRQYFLSQAPSSRKLQIGCGHNVLPGWLNTDLNPRQRGAIYLNATKRFPFQDASFDYVFSEHIIEHLPYMKGVFMVREAYRVLKPGGKLRIATPDLQFLIDLHRGDKTDVQQRYIRYAIDVFQPQLGVYQDANVINYFFHAWGHQFIYDEESLRKIFSDCGFQGLSRCLPGDSGDVNLFGIESHGRIIPDEFNRLETLVLEGQKPH